MTDLLTRTKIFPAAAARWARRGGAGPATEFRPGRLTLQQAASLVFALISVLPLLVFAYSLYSLNAINEIEYEIGLGLALAVALLGFYIFRRLMTRMSDLVRAVGQVRRHVPVTSPDADVRVPGIGAIQEFSEMADLVHQLWKAEAELHMGERVLVSVRNATDPLAGTLVRATDDGVVLETEGQQTPVSYRRILAIEASGLPSADRASPPRGVPR